MSDYTVELSGDAQDQISDIYGCIRDEFCNLSAAESFLDDIETAIDSLERFPYAHMVRPDSIRWVDTRSASTSSVKITACSTS